MPQPPLPWEHFRANEPLSYATTALGTLGLPGEYFRGGIESLGRVGKNLFTGSNDDPDWGHRADWGLVGNLIADPLNMLAGLPLAKAVLTAGKVAKANKASEALRAIGYMPEEVAGLTKIRSSPQTAFDLVMPEQELIAKWKTALTPHLGHFPDMRDSEVLADAMQHANTLHRLQEPTGMGQELDELAINAFNPRTLPSAPRVVYHGTAAAPFEKFHPDPGTNNWMGKGAAYFTGEPKAAESYVSFNKTPLYTATGERQADQLRDALIGIPLPKRSGKRLLRDFDNAVVASPHVGHLTQRLPRTIEDAIESRQRQLLEIASENPEWEAVKNRIHDIARGKSSPSTLPELPNDVSFSTDLMGNWHAKQNGMTLAISPTKEAAASEALIKLRGQGLGESNLMADWENMVASGFVNPDEALDEIAKLPEMRRILERAQDPFQQIWARDMLEATEQASQKAKQLANSLNRGTPHIMQRVIDARNPFTFEDAATPAAVEKLLAESRLDRAAADRVRGLVNPPPLSWSHDVLDPAESMARNTRYKEIYSPSSGSWANTIGKLPDGRYEVWDFDEGVSKGIFGSLEEAQQHVVANVNQRRLGDVWAAMAARHGGGMKPDAISDVLERSGYDALQHGEDFSPAWEGRGYSDYIGPPPIDMHSEIVPFRTEQIYLPFIAPALEPIPRVAPRAIPLATLQAALLAASLLKGQRSGRGQDETDIAVHGVTPLDLPQAITQKQPATSSAFP
jgi:hypothetical protein